MKNPIVIVLLVLLGFICTFLTGFYLSYLLNAEKDSLPLATPVPSNAVATGSAELTTQFLPDKFYFEDTAILMSKTEPRYTIASTVARAEVQDGYTQSARISYFDGSKWVRKIDTLKTKDSAVVTTSLLRKWQITYDPSRVLKQSAIGGFSVNGTTIDFVTGTLANEIGMRSLPGYTKFMSRGEGSLTINGTRHEAFVLYTRIYSSNASAIQFYTTPLGVTTDWTAFWDQSGNFYHVDKTSVAKPTEIYQTHEIGVRESSDGNVIKTFKVDARHDAPKAPKLFTLGLGAPLSETLQLSVVNQFDKYPGISYVWFMGHVQGEVKKADGTSDPGFGLVEFIQD